MDDSIGLLTDRVDTLYVSDPRGRLVGTNEWDSRPAPRFHLMLTAQGPICRFRGDVSDELAGSLEAICRREPVREPGPDLPRQRGQLLEALGAHAGVRNVWCGPAYWLRQAARRRGPAISIDETNSELLEPCFPDWRADAAHRRPFKAVVVDGRAVAICASVRISPAVHCAGVETHPDYRRRGYAPRAVAAWAKAVRALGATPFYSTAWENVASQAVARRLGFQMVGVDFHVT